MIDAYRESELPPEGSVHSQETDASCSDAQGEDLGALRAKRLCRSLEVRRGNLAFSIRATAKHLGINEKIVRLIVRGERPVADHHVENLPPTLREEVLHGRPSERFAVAPMAKKGSL